MIRSFTYTTAVIASLAMLQGCAADLSEELEQEAAANNDSEDTSSDTSSDASGSGADASDSGSDTTDVTDEEASHFTHFPEDDGKTLTLVDATDSETWVYFDLESMEEARPTAATVDGSWDVGFQRYKLKLNGGYFGNGNVMAAALEGVSFDEVTEAPVEGWEFDRADSEEDEDEDPEYVFGGWYSYDPSTHILTPKEIVYVVRTVEGNFYKIEVAGYYNQEGESGYPSIRWAAVNGPSGDLVEPAPEGVGAESGDVVVEPGDDDSTTGGEDSGTTTDDDTTDSDEGGALGTLVDASDTQEWVYLSLTNGVVDVADETTSFAWDLAILRTNFRTNSGSSGPGIAGVARIAGRDNYEGRETADTVGYYSDVLITPEWPEGAPEFSGNEVLGSWYNYEFSTHTVTPKDEYYFLRTATGDYAKMLIHGYESGIFDLSWELIERQAEMHTMTIDFEEDLSWVYLNLRTGRLVEVQGEDDLSWDLAFSGMKIRTNSGTSGQGQGGVVATEATSLDDVVDVTADSVAVDEVVSFDEVDGSSDVSASAVLAEWFDYESSTGAVTTKGLVYHVATSTGEFAKIRIDGYEQSILSISWVYAGPGSDQY